MKRLLASLVAAVALFCAPAARAQSAHYPASIYTFTPPTGPCVISDPLQQSGCITKTMFIQASAEISALETALGINLTNLKNFTFTDPTVTDKLLLGTALSTSAPTKAAVNIPPMTADPGTVANGDYWINGPDWKFKSGGSVYTLHSTQVGYTGVEYASALLTQRDTLRLGGATSCADVYDAALGKYVTACSTSVGATSFLQLSDAPNTTYAGYADKFVRVGHGEAGLAYGTIAIADVPGLPGSKISSGAVGTTYGGTGIDTHTVTGVPRVVSGSWSVDATTSDVPEGSRPYYTDARARAALSATSPVAYSSSTGVVSLGIVTPGLGGAGISLSGIAKGGFVAGTGAGTFGIRTVGADGTCVKADSSSSTGLSYGACSVGSVTSVDVAGISGILTASGGPITTNGTISLALASQAAHKVLIGPTSSSAAPTFRVLAPSDNLPSQGGLGFDASTIALGGVVTGSGPGTFAITAAGLDGLCFVADSSKPGGVDWQSCTAGGVGSHFLLSATHPDTVPHTPLLGDLIYADGTPAWAALGGNTSSTKQFLQQTGTGSVSAAPSWAALVSGDIPNLDAAKITTGTFSASRLPNPTSSTLGGIESYAAVSNQWINAISTAGVPSSTQPAFTDISGTATTGQIPNLAASKITSGVLDTARVVSGSVTNSRCLRVNSSGLVVVDSTDCSTGGGTVTSIDATVPSFLSVSGVPISGAGTIAITLATEAANLVFAGPTTGSAVAPTFRSLVSADIPNLDAAKLTSGTLSAARLPNPTASTLGGIESLAAVTSNWIDSISTSGVPHAAQPAFTDISGTAATAQVVTGTITNSRCLHVDGSGNVTVASGDCGTGAVTGSASSGQVTFWSGSASIAGSTNFLWDDTNKILKLAGANSEERFFATDATHYVGFKAGAVSTNVTWTWPLADGGLNQCLTTSGGGVLSFQDCATASGGAVTGTGSTNVIPLWSSGSAITTSSFSTGGASSTVMKAANAQYGSNSGALQFGIPSGGTPTIVTSTSVNSSASTTSVPVNIPSGTVSGDLLMAFVAGTAQTNPLSGLPTGWAFLLNNSCAGCFTNRTRGTVIYKVADGSDVNFTFTAGDAGEFTSRTYRINNFDPAVAPQIATPAVAASTTAPNPPSLTPSWGSANNLWIAMAWNNNTTATGFPAGYTNTSTQLFTFRALHLASRSATATSEDPGAFTLGSAEDIGATTIAIKPAGAASTQTAWLITTGGELQPATTYALGLVAQSVLKFYGSSTTYVGFQAPASISSSVTWTLPGADGSSGQCLVTNASGVLSFANCATSSGGGVTGGGTTNFMPIWSTASNIVASAFQTGGSSSTIMKASGAQFASYSGALNLGVPGAASPTIATTAETTANGTATPTFSVPTGIVSGDLLLLTIGNDDPAGSITAGLTGWTLLNNTGFGTNNHQYWAYYKIASGSESAFQITYNSGTPYWAAKIYRINNFDSSVAPAIATVGNGQGTNPDPPSLTPSWGSAATLWIAQADVYVNGCPSAFPASYTATGTLNNSGHVCLGYASRVNTTATEDPGSFTSVNAYKIAATIGVKPPGTNATQVAYQIDTNGDLYSVMRANGFSFVGTAAGSTPAISAYGIDSNIALLLAAKGTSSVQIKANSVTWTWPTTDVAGFMKSNGSGTLSLAALVSGDIPNLDTAKITTGTFAAARLPNPTSTTLGGIQSYAAVTSQWINAISTSGVPSSAQPAFTDISGTASTGQIPNLDASKITTGTLGTARGGSGVSSPTVHGVLFGEGASAFTALTMSADTLLHGLGTGTDPEALAIVNCGDSSHALAYSTSTHTFGCQAISTGATTWTILTKSADYTILSGDVAGLGLVIICDTSGGIRTMTLPAASAVGGKKIEVKREGGSTCSITRAGADTLYDNASATSVDLLADGQSISIMSDGSSSWPLL